MMRLAPVFFTLILLTATLSGCMGNDDEISERDAKITDLESQIEDLNSENENLTSQLETLNGENENLNSQVCKQDKKREIFLMFSLRFSTRCAKT